MEGSVVIIRRKLRVAAEVVEAIETADLSFGIKAKLEIHIL